MKNVLLISCAALTAACTTACSSAPLPGAPATNDDPTSSTKENLYVDGNHLWGKAPFVNFCWNFAGWETEKGWVQDASWAWADSAGAGFAFAPACDGNEPTGSIPINEHSDGTAPHTDGLGTNAGAVDFDFTFSNWSTGCQSKRETCIRTIAVHELGHVLGFAHEQNEAQTPEWCKELKPSQGDNGTYYATRWDQRSVMDYCNPMWDNGGTLSPLDRRAAQKVYTNTGKGNIFFSADFGAPYGVLVGAAEMTDVLGQFGPTIYWQSPFNINPAIPSGSSIVAQNDFNGDYDTDFVWQSGSSLNVVLLREGAVLNTYALPKLPWFTFVVGSGDFDGDGYGDILLRNTLSGAPFVWRLDDSNTVRSVDTLLGSVSFDWVVQGVGDFDGNGVSDILWRQKSTGDVSIWFLDSGLPPAQGKLGAVTVTSTPMIWTGVNAVWQIVGIGDFDGDGKSDVLWRHTQNGGLLEWQMNGSTIAATWSPGNAYPGNLGTDWQVQGVVDMNSDGIDDIVWRHMPYGDVHIWVMDPGEGNVHRDVAAITDGSEQGWKIVGTNKWLQGALR